MSDLLSDQRAKDLLAADPSVVNGLVVMFREVAAQAQATADGLRGAAGDANWTGSAADAFRHGLGKLPDDLAKVTSSYQEAADGLNAFEGELSSLKPAFQSIVSQLQGAHSQLAGAQSQLQSAQSALSTAQAQAVAKSFSSPLTPLAPVPLNSPLHTAVNAASGAVSNAQGEIAALTSRGFRLLDEFEGARGSAQGRVSSASQVPPHRGFWDSVFHDVGNWLSDAGHFLVDVGKGIFNSVTGTWSAIENFANHPTWANFGKLAADVAVDASIVVLAAAAPEALGLVGAEIGAEGATAEGVSLAARLAALGTNAETVATGATGAKAAADFMQGHYADGTIDLAFLAAPHGDNVVNAFGFGDRAAESAAGTAEDLSTFSWFTDRGLTAGEAMSLMSDGEVRSVLDNVNDVTSKAGVASATRSAVAAATKSARVAAGVGRPVAFALDSVKDKVQEGTQKAAEHLLHPETTTCP